MVLGWTLFTNLKMLHAVTHRSTGVSFLPLHRLYMRRASPKHHLLPFGTLVSQETRQSFDSLIPELPS